MVTNSEHGPTINRLALSGTVHCLTGCSIGEVLGMVIGTSLGRLPPPSPSPSPSRLSSVHYTLTLLPLLRAGLPWGSALPIALAADTLSIAVMEIVDNAIMLLIPGAMDAHPSDPLFWGSLVLSLLLAGVAAFPVARWLITRGRGHALVHEHHTARARHMPRDHAHH